MKYELKFMCKCGGTALEEIVTDTTVISPVLNIVEEGPGEVSLIYGPIQNEGGEVIRYQCVKCGDSIPDCSSPEELLEYLRDHDNLLQPHIVTEEEQQLTCDECGYVMYAGETAFVGSITSDGSRCVMCPLSIELKKED